MNVVLERRMGGYIGLFSGSLYYSRSSIEIECVSRRMNELKF